MITTTTLTPSRIGCPSIPGTMKGIVSSLPGVSKTVVRYENRTLEVTYDNEVTSVEEIIKTVGREMGLAMREGEPDTDDTPEETCPM